MCAYYLFCLSEQEWVDLCTSLFWALWWNWQMRCQLLLWHPIFKKDLIQGSFDVILSLFPHEIGLTSIMCLVTFLVLFWLFVYWTKQTSGHHRLPRFYLTPILRIISWFCTFTLRKGKWFVANEGRFKDRVVLALDVLKETGIHGVDVLMERNFVRLHYFYL